MTHIIHNAWNVNFNHTLASFEPQISGTRKLLDICATSSRPIRLLFVSSVSAAKNWCISDGEVPEEPLADPMQTSTNGYGASKFVVENVRYSLLFLAAVIVKTVWTDSLEGGAAGHPMHESTRRPGVWCAQLGSMAYLGVGTHHAQVERCTGRASQPRGGE